MKIIGVGDNTVDCYLDRNSMFPGGNAVNVAVLGKRFGFDEAAYIGTIANDRKGRLVLRALTGEGINTTQLRIVSGKNSFEEVALIDGDRVFKDSFCGVSYNLILDKTDYDFIANYDILHSSIYSNVESQLKALSQLDIKIAFDFSDSFNESYLDNNLQYVDYAFFSGSTLSTLEITALINKSIAKGCQLVVITRGKNGATLYYEGQIYHQNIVQTTVIDTLGAGDAFIASVLLGLSRKQSMPDTLQTAAINAAKTCSYYGAFGYEEKIDDISFI